MSVKVMGKIWDMELPSTQKFVLLAMADHADHDGNRVFPSLELIARKTGFSRRCVINVIRKSQEDGVLELVKEGGGRNHTNLYRFTLGENSERRSPFPDNGYPPSKVTNSERRSINGERRSPKPSYNRPKDVSSNTKDVLEETANAVASPVPQPSTFQATGQPTDDVPLEEAVTSLSEDAPQRSADAAKDTAALLGGGGATTGGLYGGSKRGTESADPEAAKEKRWKLFEQKKICDELERIYAEGLSVVLGSKVSPTATKKERGQLWHFYCRFFAGNLPEARKAIGAIMDRWGKFACLRFMDRKDGRGIPEMGPILAFAPKLLAELEGNGEWVTADAIAGDRVVDVITQGGVRAKARVGKTWVFRGQRFEGESRLWDFLRSGEGKEMETKEFESWYLGMKETGEVKCYG